MTEQPTRRQIVNCAFSSWHSHPVLRKHSLRATAIDLRPSFLTYLAADGVIIPEGSGLTDTQPSEIPDDADGSDIEESYSFPELDAAIRQLIDNHGGAVFPKLNWSAPQDAAWISASGNQTLLCRCPADIYLLLKASDFIVHDLEHAFDECIDDGTEMPPVQLVLKKWFDMPRSNEFRCFVKESQLIGISARDSNYYAFLADSTSLQEQIVQRILDFYAGVVAPNFPDQSYVFDVYLTRDFGRVFLIDFNPWATRTDALLFSWQELAEIITDRPMLRIVTSETQASQSRPRYARYPKDVTQLSQGQTIADFAADWQRALAEAAAGSDEETRSNASRSTQNIGR